MSNKTILLVEDETLVRLIGCDFLADAGYEVLEAASADEALNILRSVDNIQLLFTDIRMPGSMDGLQLANLVHDLWPGIKILITSGDTFPPQANLPSEGRFLPKPYASGELKREIDLLSAR